MKSLIFLLVLTFATSVLAQKKYVDPNERQKRGLLEEGEASLKNAESPSPAQVAVPSELGPQAQICECVKLKRMNEQLSSLWWRGDEVIRATTSRDEINGREENVKSTMVHLVSSNRHVKPIPSQDKCPGFAIGESNISKLLEMIEKQEKKCDVYKLRGIDHD